MALPQLILRAFHAHADALHQLRNFQDEACARPFISLEENVCIDANLDRHQQVYVRCQPLSFKVYEGNTPSAHEKTACAYTRTTLLPALEARARELCDTLEHTMRVLIDLLVQGPAHTNAQMQPTLQSGVDRMMGPWIQIGGAPIGAGCTTKGYVALANSMAAAEHLILAIALNTGFGKGPLWNLSWTFASTPTTFTVQAPTQAQALEWAALLVHNAIVGDPSRPVSIARVITLKDRKAMFAKAARAYLKP